MCVHRNREQSMLLFILLGKVPLKLFGSFLEQSTGQLFCLKLLFENLVIRYFFELSTIVLSDASEEILNYRRDSKLRVHYTGIKSQQELLCCDKNIIREIKRLICPRNEACRERGEKEPFRFPPKKSPRGFMAGNGDKKLVRRFSRQTARKVKCLRRYIVT